MMGFVKKIEGDPENPAFRYCHLVKDTSKFYVQNSRCFWWH